MFPNKIIILIIIIISSLQIILPCNSSSLDEDNKDKNFESSPYTSFLKSLDDPAISTVGILHSAYSNSKLPEAAWSRCEYCTICPNFQEPSSTKDNSYNFLPCPEKLNILSDKVRTEHDYIRAIWDRYTSEYLGLSSKSVYIVTRVLARNGPMTPLPSTKQKNDRDGEHVLIPEMNVTLSKFKLDRVDFDAVVKPEKDDKSSGKGEDVTWNKLCFKDPLQGPRLLFGDASFKDKGWKGQGTETTAVWPIKDGLSRKVVFLSLLELVELRELGCACIRRLLGPQFTGTLQELEEICRATLDVTREELRSALKLSTCLTPGEETKLRSKKPSPEDKDSGIHAEL